MSFNTQSLILEGPDLSGKTTLYEDLHKLSGFKWNIQDRSCLSMVCYAIQFGRDASKWRRQLDLEMSNLNNRMVVLIPKLSVLEERYHQRGDEVQDIDSLRRLYEIFENEIERLGTRPTLKVIRSSWSSNQNASNVLKWIESLESSSPGDVGTVIKDYVLNSKKDEHVLDVTIENTIKEADQSIMSHPREGKYYSEILSSFDKKICNEKSGLNEYKKPQGDDSRRFYYSSDSCISSLHIMPRDEILEVVCSLRSTDVVRNGAIDLVFLDYMLSVLGQNHFKNYRNYNMRVRFNSAHFRRDLE